MKQIRVSIKNDVDIVYIENTIEIIAYRKPFWTIVAVDRLRFQDRISQVEPIITRNIEYKLARGPLFIRPEEQ